MDAAERAIEPLDAPAVVTVRYWAGARAAAGVDVETVPAARTVAELVARLGAQRAELRPVLAVASVLVDGRTGSGEDPVPVGALVEVLPPFAGG
jgi:molybdopterin converting factor small subunit